LSWGSSRLFCFGKLYGFESQGVSAHHLHLACAAPGAAQHQVGHLELLSATAAPCQ
jgi:hypothetical protein